MAGMVRIRARNRAALGTVSIEGEETPTMPLFPSPAWMDAFTDELLGQDDFDQVARVLDGIYRFVIEPQGSLERQHTYDVVIRPDGDRPTAARLDGLADRPRLTMAAGYERWRQLISGELDVKRAMLLRRLRVRGDLSPLLGGLSSARPLMDALGAVDTQWH
jgi:hypothetical protein